MKVLITGEHGYIASSLADYFQSRRPDWEVRKLSVRGDAWKDISFQGADVLIHTAGIVHCSEKRVSAEEYKKTNIQLSLELAEKCRREGTGQFIFMSTMSVYGLEQGKIGPDTPETPKTLYGRSKWKAEQLLLKRLSDGADGTVLTIVRPPMVYGPGCPGNYGRLSKLAHGLFVFPKTGNRRSVIYIGNLCECLLQLVEQKREGIVCPQDNEYMNPSELVQRIAGCRGHSCFLLPGFEGLLELTGRHIGVVEKVFGTLIYEKSLSDIPGITYQITGSEQAVRITEASDYRL